MRPPSLVPLAHRSIVGLVTLVLVVPVPVPALPAAALAVGVAAGAAVQVTTPDARGATRLLDVVAEPLQSTSKRTPVQVGVANPRGQRVTLQRRDGQRWRTVRTRATPTRGEVGWVKLTLPAKAGDVEYRVVLPVSRAGGAQAQRTFTVFQSDDRKHARYVAKARSYIRRYCPTTPILIDTPAIRPQIAGLARTTVVGPYAPAGSRTATRMRWTQAIELRSGMSETLLRHAALHECAHIVQARPRVAGTKAAAKRLKLTEKRYGATGAAARERQADCMASAITGSRRHMYYVRSCTRAQLKDARAMWRAYGTRYQSPTLTWKARP